MSSFNSPFRGLKQVFKSTSQSPRQVEKPASANPSFSDAEARQTQEELFRQEMVDVVPLGKKDRSRVGEVPPALLSRRPLIDSEAEALAELSDLASGKKGFDITDTDEYIEGAIIGLDPRLGDWPVDKAAGKRLPDSALLHPGY